ncbi:hypothetical protein [Ruegeria halocynthiae]|uniref:hypothetical protein n=1 Tax=Ruegeria halocynthiae TaxID=985054 RepID=UPI000B1B4EAC|nr:hypothetical protein [Ruegeria halocynthiae]
MGQFPQSFEVYGYTIEVHAGGRRVWPPSFKRFVKTKLDLGELTVGDIMKDCNVSQSLVYKWRSDVKSSRVRSVARNEERIFSEVLINEETQPNRDLETDNRILLTHRESTLSFPANYPVNDLVKIALAMDKQS